MQAARDSRGFSVLETLVVVGLIGVVAAIAVPMSGNALGYYRISGNARSLSNEIAVAKMRAASTFGRARVYVDLPGKAFHIETRKNATSNWVVESGTTYLNPQVSFGYGVVATAPPNTQASIGQAPACTDNSDHPIGNTACIVFNSRGIPIDPAGAPSSTALYLTDGTGVYATTLSATGMTRVWRTQPLSTPSWILQ